MTVLLVETLLIGLGTYLIRAVSLSLGGRFAWPSWAERWLQFATPAVLGALLGPSLFLQNSHWISLAQNSMLLAAIPTALVAWWSRHLLWTVTAGIFCFTITSHIM